MLATVASAQVTITVANASFEDYALTNGSEEPGPGTTSWTASAGSGLHYSGAYRNSGSFNSGVPDGNQDFFLQAGYVYQDLGVTIAQGFTYTITGYIGARNDDMGQGTVIGTISLYTRSGTFLSSSGQVTPSFGNFTFVSFDYIGTALMTGQELEIRLEVNDPQAHFDLIGATYAIPEPSTSAAIAGVGALGLVFAFRRFKSRQVSTAPAA